MKYRLLLHRVWATHPQCWHIKDILSTRGGIRPTPPLANLVLHLRSKPLWSSSLEHCFYFAFSKSLRQEGQRESHKDHFASLSLFLPAHTVGCICNQRLTLLAILSPNAVIKCKNKAIHFSSPPPSHSDVSLKTILWSASKQSSRMTFSDFILETRYEWHRDKNNNFR